MGRLIDADELIKYIKIWEIGTSISSDQKEFIDCINNQPTAFDVNASVNDIVDKLQELKNKYSNFALMNNDISEMKKYIGMTQAIAVAIEIVKEGGVE